MLTTKTTSGSFYSRDLQDKHLHKHKNEYDVFAYILIIKVTKYLSKITGSDINRQEVPLSDSYLLLTQDTPNKPQRPFNGIVWFPLIGSHSLYYKGKCVCIINTNQYCLTEEEYTRFIDYEVSFLDEDEDDD